MYRGLAVWWLQWLSISIDRWRKSVVLNHLYLRCWRCPVIIHLSLTTLFLFFVYYLVHASIDASPVPSIDNHFVSDANRCTDLTLSNYMEHCVELSCHYLFVYLGRYSSKHSMPKDTRGKQSYWKLDMESAVVVCRASPSVIRLCVACARVRACLSD